MHGSMNVKKDVHEFYAKQETSSWVSRCEYTGLDLVEMCAQT